MFSQRKCAAAVATASQTREVFPQPCRSLSLSLALTLTHLGLGDPVPGQLHDGEVPLAESALDVVEAHADRSPEPCFLVTVSHDHAFW